MSKLKLYWSMMNKSIYFIFSLDWDYKIFITRSWGWSRTHRSTSGTCTRTSLSFERYVPSWYQTSPIQRSHPNSIISQVSKYQFRYQRPRNALAVPVGGAWSPTWLTCARTAISWNFQSYFPFKLRLLNCPKSASSLFDFLFLH